MFFFFPPFELWGTQILKDKDHTNCTGCVLLDCIPIVPWALMVFWKKKGGWMSYNAKYMVASMQLPALLRSLIDFTLCYFVILLYFFWILFYFIVFIDVVSLLRMQLWASKSFPFLCLKVCGLFSKRDQGAPGDGKQLVSEMQSPCLCICVNLRNVPMYIIL